MCVFTGRWLRTALAGAWATCLVMILGVPDGIWGSRLETFLITSAVFVAVIGTLALIITVRACLSLTLTASLAAACGNPAAPTARHPAASAARPVSCRQQYEDWKHGPGFAQYSRLRADVNAVHAAEESGNAAALKSAMKKRVPAVLANGNPDPVPRCADPADRYVEYLTVIYTAGNNARAARGLGGLLKAAAPLNRLRDIEVQLDAEADRALAKR